MILQIPEHTGPTAPNQALQIAFQLLSEAWQYAVEANIDPWQFAIEIGEFQQTGVTKSELRWLVVRRYALPAEEITPPLETRRQFRPLKNILLPERSCFILSESGAALLKVPIVKQHKIVRTSIKITHQNDAKLPSHTEKLSASKLVPHWDQERRVLHLGQRIIKQFRTPSPIQELIITAFQEAGWPARIDDPLPQIPEQESKRRLNNAIRCLNRNQVQKLIRFRGDGSGTGITWEVCPSKNI